MPTYLNDAAIILNLSIQFGQKMNYFSFQTWDDNKSWIRHQNELLYTNTIERERECVCYSKVFIQIERQTLGQTTGYETYSGGQVTKEQTEG